jgi:hypothetical protein
MEYNGSGSFLLNIIVDKNQSRRRAHDLLPRRNSDALRRRCPLFLELHVGLDESLEAPQNSKTQQHHEFRTRVFADITLGVDVME